MDPMDYVYNNHPRSSATQYDPVHAVAGSWGPQPNPPPSRAAPFPWAHPPRTSPTLHRIPALDPYQIPSNGGLPPPYPGFYGTPLPNEFPGQAPQHFHLPYGHSPMTRRGGDPAGLENDDAFINQIPGPVRPVSFPAPTGLGMFSTGSNHELNSSRPSLPLSGLPIHSFSQNHSALPPPGPGSINSAPPRRNHHPPSVPSPRPPREVQSPTRTTQPTVSRRPHPRARRSMSRFQPPDLGDEEDDELARQFLDQLRRNGYHGDLTGLDDQFLRQIQLVRGSSNVQQVASKRTLQSLQSVEIKDLDESDRVCIICYNEFGTETPEGINEAPLRLPKCKHVFGDHCIKKWFENSDNCPYCRDKVPSEPKNVISSSRAFLTMMRIRAHHTPETARGTSRPTTLESELGNRQNPTSGRRSPPEDVGEQQRRTRPRRGDPSAPPRSSAQSAPAATSATSVPSALSVQSAPPVPAAPAVPNVYNTQFSSTGPTPVTPQTSMPRQRMASQPSHRGWNHPPASWETVGGVRRMSSPPTSMSGSAPSFYPQGPNNMDYTIRNISNDAPFLPIPPPASSMLPNPLHPTGDFTQRRRQQDAANISGLRPHLVNMPVGSGNGGHASLIHDNANQSL